MSYNFYGAEVAISVIMSHKITKLSINPMLCYIKIILLKILKGIIFTLFCVKNLFPYV